MVYLTVMRGILRYVSLTSGESLGSAQKFKGRPYFPDRQSVTCSELYKDWSGTRKHCPPTTATNSTTSFTAILVDVSLQHYSSSEAARGAHQAPRRRLLSGWAFNLTFDLKDLIPSALNQALSTTTISMNGKSSLLGTIYIHRTLTRRLIACLNLGLLIPCSMSPKHHFIDTTTNIWLDLLSEGGFFKARLSFPPEFPLLPPKMRFITPMWHPNSKCLWPDASALLNFFSVYPDGTVCVSILVS